METPSPTRHTSNDAFDQFRETLHVLDAKIEQAIECQSLEDITNALGARINHVQRKRDAVNYAIKTLEKNGLVSLQIYRLARNEEVYLNELLVQSYARLHTAPEYHSWKSPQDWDKLQ